MSTRQRTLAVLLGVLPVAVMALLVVRSFAPSVRGGTTVIRAELSGAAQPEAQSTDTEQGAATDPVGEQIIVAGAGGDEIDAVARPAGADEATVAEVFRPCRH